ATSKHQKAGSSKSLKNNRVRQAQERARPLEEKGVKILKENLSAFSEMDACSALGTNLNRV
ncbi:hypothetical protein, partial [Streptococcus anginosus]|uniref:hypothetical protein n=1 Tax=Streptococcus anginosus TaxID=1328 RepID=UPI0021F8AFC9